LQYKDDVCNSTTQSEKKLGHKDCYKSKSKMLQNIRFQNFI